MQCAVNGDIITYKFKRNVNVLHFSVLTRVFDPTYARLVVLVHGDGVSIADFTSVPSGVEFGIEPL